MKHFIIVAIAISIAVAIGTARADTVTDWNATAQEVFKVARVGGAPRARALAMMHVAMSDAINSVQGRYTCYITTVSAVPGASAEVNVQTWSAARGLPATSVAPPVPPLTRAV